MEMNMRVLCVLIEGGKCLHEIAECCYRWTPQIALREGEAIFLEVGSCQRIYNEETLFLKIKALLKRFGVRGRVGIGDDPALSLCYARLGEPRGVPLRELPLQALYDVASPFKKDKALFKETEQLVAVLQKLGLRNLEEFLKLSPSSLSSRFSDLGIELHRRLKGSRTSLLWPSYIPPEKIEEKMNLDDFENCQTLEPLLFLIKNLVTRSMARLAGRSERVTRFELELELEKHSFVKTARRHWSFSLPLPQGSVSSLLPLIHERLQTDFQRQPLDSCVRHMKLSIVETVPGQYGQKNFFNKREEEQEAWNSLMARLCQKLGKEHTFVASPTEGYRPESGWKKSWPESHQVEKTKDEALHATLNGIELPFPQRPLRLLKAPVPLFKVQNTLIQSSENESKRWEIHNWDGPERLQGEWWSGADALKRDYFRVGTETGEELWIFRIPDSDKLFLHGYFD